VTDDIDIDGALDKDDDHDAVQASDVAWLLGQLDAECEVIAKLEDRLREARWFRAAHIRDLQSVGWSLQQLATRRKVSKQAVHQWARFDGDPPPSADTRTARPGMHARSHVPR
jgi:hypothetical protein